VRPTTPSARRVRRAGPATRRSTARHRLCIASLARPARRKRVKAPHTATRAVQGGTRVLPA
jgi:hypothetical protein